MPVSLVWRKDIHTPKALLLYGYGAYGTPMRPYYQPQVLSLLEVPYVGSSPAAEKAASSASSCTSCPYRLMTSLRCKTR